MITTAVIHNSGIWIKNKAKLCNNVGLKGVLEFVLEGFFGTFSKKTWMMKSNGLLCNQLPKNTSMKLLNLVRRILHLVVLKSVSASYLAHTSRSNHLHLLTPNLDLAGLQDVWWLLLMTRGSHICFTLWLLNYFIFTWSACLLLLF